MKQSAGLVVYRRQDKQLEVLLVHPSGNYNRHAPWGIPKGLLDEGESLAGAAVRETREETGVDVGRPNNVGSPTNVGMAMEDRLTSLRHVDYTRGRKRIHAFAVAASADAAPHPVSWEVDRAEFFPLDEALRIIHPDQRPFLDRLVELLRAPVS